MDSGGRGGTGALPTVERESLSDEPERQSDRNRCSRSTGGVRSRSKPPADAHATAAVIARAE
jgi:hypothetical protein